MAHRHSTIAARPSRFRNVTFGIERALVICMTIQSLTYGTMPDRNTQRAGWDYEQVGDTYYYLLRGEDSDVANDLGLETEANLPFDEFCEFIQILTNAFQDGNERAGELASCFLATLGIEWI